MPGEDNLLNKNISTENPFSKELYEKDDYSKLRKDESAFSRGFQDYRSGAEKRHDLIKKNYDPTQEKYTSSENHLRQAVLDNYAQLAERNQINYQNQLAKNQSSLEKFANSQVNFATTVGTTVLGSTIGLVYGGAQAIASGDIDKLWDNEFQRSLDDFSNGIRKEFQIYRGLTDESTFDAVENFVFDDLTQGAGFIAGAILSEMLTAGLGTAGLAGNVTGRTLKALKYTDEVLKAGKGLNLIDDVAKQSIIKRAKDVNRAARRNMIGKSIDDSVDMTRRFAVGTHFEASLEARMAKDEMMSAMMDDYRAKNPEYIDKPIPEHELAKMNEISENNAIGVYAANAALVGYSNAKMFKSIFGAKALNTTGGYKKYLTRKGLKITADKTKATKDKIKAFALNPLREGLVEEMGQSTITQTGVNYAKATYANDGVGSWNNLIDSLGDAFVQTYAGGSHAWREGLAGMVLGFLGLPTPKIRNAKSDSKIKGIPVGNGKTVGIGFQGGSIGEFKEIKEEYAKAFEIAGEAQKKRSQAIKSHADMLAKQDMIAKEMQEAVKTENDFRYKTAEDDQAFNFFEASLKANRMDDVMEDLKDMKSMSDEEFRAEMGIDEDVEIDRERLVDSIEKRYNLADKSFKKAEELVPYSSEEVKSIVARNLFQLGRLQERSEKLRDQFEDITGLGTYSNINRVFGDAIKSINKAAKANIEVGDIEGIKETPKYIKDSDVSKFSSPESDNLKEALRGVNVSDRAKLVEIYKDIEQINDLGEKLNDEMAQAIIDPEKFDKDIVKFSDNEKRDYLSSIQGYRKIDREGYKVSIKDNFDGTFNIAEYDNSGNKITGIMRGLSIDEAYSYMKNGFIQQETVEKEKVKKQEDQKEDIFDMDAVKPKKENYDDDGLRWDIDGVEKHLTQKEFVAKYGDIGDKFSVVDFLTEFSKNKEADKELTLLASNILPYFTDEDFVELQYGDSPGVYSLGVGVYIDPRFFVQGGLNNPASVESVILHELVHQISSNQINKDANFESELKRLLDLVKNSEEYKKHSKNFTGKGSYGLKNEHELLAEAFSNKGFQQLLAKVEDPNHKNESNYVWKELVRAIKDMMDKLLNIKDNSVLDTIADLMEFNATNGFDHSFLEAASETSDRENSEDEVLPKNFEGQLKRSPSTLFDTVASSTNPLKIKSYDNETKSSSESQIENPNKDNFGMSANSQVRNYSRFLNNQDLNIKDFKFVLFKPSLNNYKSRNSRDLLSDQTKAEIEVEANKKGGKKYNNNVVAGYFVDKDGDPVNYKGEKIEGGLGNSDIKNQLYYLF